MDPIAPRPSIGRIVLYESATGSGVKYPAIVIRTRDSTDPAVIERWGPNPSGEEVPKPEGLVAELPSDFHVDLLIFGLGSDYREFCVPFMAQQVEYGDDPAKFPRTWNWPPRI